MTPLDLFCYIIAAAAGLVIGTLLIVIAAWLHTWFSEYKGPNHE